MNTNVVPEIDLAAFANHAAHLTPDCADWLNWTHHANLENETETPLASNLQGKELLATDLPANPCSLTVIKARKDWIFDLEVSPMWTAAAFILLTQISADD